MSEYTEAQLRYRRSKGVSLAWKNERGLVQQGRGTRAWSVPEQKELLNTGRVHGYQGHHMVSVSRRPDQADNPKNIQFLCTRKGNNEHLAAHKGDYRNATEWRYNVNTGKTRSVNPDKPRAMNSYALKERAIDRRGYRHYAASTTGRQTSGTPAQAYRSSQPARSASAGSTPAKSYASGSKSGSTPQYGRSMVKPSQSRTQSSSRGASSGSSRSASSGSSRGASSGSSRSVSSGSSRGASSGGQKR